MGNNLIFKDSIAARDAITASQKKEIAGLYQNWADEIGERAKFYASQSTASSVVSERQMRELERMLITTSQNVSNEVYNKVTNNMYLISDAVVADNVKWLESFGFSADGVNAAFNNVSDNVVRNIVTGQIYDSGWSLSKAIWSDNEKALKDIYQIVGKGVAQNMPIYDIAKNLEAYVSPDKRKNWNLTAPDGVKIFKKSVDYNAQRLARTLVQHSYQQSFIATTQKNPFITEYEWYSNGSRVCPLCLSRHGEKFKKDELPMDHPNGMCVMVPVISDNMVDQLADWFNSPDGTYPEIDEFAKNFGYTPSKTSKISTPQDFVNKYGTSTKNPKAWKQSLTEAQKAEVKILKDAEGLTWNEFYNKYVYAGSADDMAAWEAKQAAKKAAKKAAKTETTIAKVFTETQDKYLSPYGFSPDKMPVDFDDWSHKISYNQATEILTKMGTDWSDPHPYQQIKKFYDANLVNPNITTKVVTKVDDAVAAAKVSKTTKTTFNASSWVDSLNKNDLGSMENWTDDWLRTISSTEKSGVNVYTSNAYNDMNRYLRGISSSTSYEKEIDAARSALSKANLPQEVITRRGSDYNMLRELGMGNITPDNKDRVIGAIVQDKGFTSTSPAPGGGFSGDIEYVIKVPKGSQAMYVAPISEYQNEKELLINCGSKYVVEDVEFNSYGSVRKIYMTLVNLQG